MPRPLYIICAESGGEDKDNKLISLYHVLEKFQLSRIPKPPEGHVVFVQWQPMRIVAVWMRNPEDEPTEYEYDIRLFVPGLAEPLPGGSGTFMFSKPMHRFTVVVASPLPLTEPGFVRAESRIRKKGASDWLSQDYLIIVEGLPPAASDNAPQSDPTN